MRIIFILLLVFLGASLFLRADYSLADISLSKDGDRVQVLELFTSQSCSSCPSADAVLEELEARHDTIIALSCNVTYWNHLHWEDTLSQDFCTQKQRSYSVEQGRAGRIFTPELMINGRQSLIGSSRSKIAAYLSQNPIGVPRILMQSLGDTLTLNMSDSGYLQNHPENEVTLIAYGEKHEQYIPSGENRGRTVHYTNPVLSMVRITQNWDGGLLRISNPKDFVGMKGYVVLVSNGSGAGEIIAAGRLDSDL